MLKPQAMNGKDSVQVLKQTQQYRTKQQTWVLTVLTSYQKHFDCSVFVHVSHYDWVSQQPHIWGIAYYRVSGSKPISVYPCLTAWSCVGQDHLGSLLLQSVLPLKAR